VEDEGNLEDVEVKEGTILKRTLRKEDWYGLTALISE
jgi:hypothetical protein